MGTHLATLDAGGAPGLSTSPRHRDDQVVHKNSKRRATCTSGKTRSAKLIAVLALAIIAGCTTVALQLVASARNGPRHVGEAGGAEPPEPGWKDVVPPLPSDHHPTWEQEHPYVDSDSIVVPSRFRRRPLVDRRFTGQRTGRPPKPEEEVPFRPPAPRDGPFGWGTDWIQGVGTPAVPPDPGEDVIEPAWCQASAVNRSFVDSVMRRRAKPVDSSERVVSCTRTKDRGRYLPEWVAYHWALGVDVMDIFDDDSVDDTREVLEPFVRAGIVKFQPRRVRRSAAATATATDNQHRDTTSDASRNDTATDDANVEELMAPINECVERYREMHHRGDPLAPSWVVLVDTDEFLWGAAVAKAAEAGGNATNSLPEVLASQSTTCCLKVSAVRHGTSGFSKTPRGLLLENFLTHADPASVELNGPPKAIVNLRASTPGGEGSSSSSSSLAENTGTSSRWSTLGGILGTGTTLDGNCQCTAAPVAEMAVRRYPTTREDLESKERRYAAEQQQQQQPAAGKFGFDAAVEAGELNDRRSDGILAWSCVVRRVLSRAANGEDVVTGRPEGSLSPHHPIAHGHGGWAIDPNGEYERQRTEACVSVVRSSPTVEDTVWGRIDSPPVWLQHACSTRYVFVHSFERTGERQVVRALESHPWTRSHVGQAAVAGGGCTMTAAIPTAGERKKATGMALFEMCGCASDVAPGCWRYCPKLQRRILAAKGRDSSSSSSSHNNINRTRRQLVQDWLLRFNFGVEPANHPVVLVEKDPDFLVASKQGLFPFVSTSILAVGHPLCSPAADGGGRGGGGGAGDAAGVREWRAVWQQVLVKQVPRAKGDVWVVRFEDLLSQEEETTSALWAAVGLPPVSPYGGASSTRTDGKSGPSNGSTPGAGSGKRFLWSRRLIVGDPLSRASPAVRNQAVPASCRARVVACERDSGCGLELLRSASLLDYFGYGGDGEILNSQRFLWGKEELEWLGKRLGSPRNDAGVERMHRLSLGQAAGTVLGLNDDGEPSVVLPQAPKPLKRPSRRQGAP